MITARTQLLALHDTSAQEAKAIMVAKNADYGASQDALRNFRLCEMLSIPMDQGILTRLGDKLARIGNLIAKGTNEVKDESIEDTIIDAVNYLIILRATIQEHRQ